MPYRQGYLKNQKLRQTAAPLAYSELKLRMLLRWLALPYYLYCLRLAALSHSYFNPL